MKRYISENEYLKSRSIANILKRRNFTEKFKTMCGKFTDFRKVSEISGTIISNLHTWFVCMNEHFYGTWTSETFENVFFSAMPYIMPIKAGALSDPLAENFFAASIPDWLFEKASAEWIQTAMTPMEGSLVYVKNKGVTGVKRKADKQEKGAKAKKAKK